MNEGWVKIHRKILENPVVCKDSDYLSVWIFLLLNATHKELPFMFNGNKIILQPGQLVTCKKNISFKLSVNESKIFRILKLFESEQQIEQQITRHGRLVTLLNWKDYQKDERQNEQQMNDNRTTNEQQVNANKNVKNDNNVKNERKTIIAPIVPYEEIMNSFNDICVSLPKLQVLTETRKTTIKTRYKELHFSVDEFKSFFRLVEESDFLTGRKMDFKASFDWITKSANFVKIREGNYVNKEGGINYGKPTNNNGKNVFKDEDLPNQTILR